MGSKIFAAICVAIFFLMFFLASMLRGTRGDGEAFLSQSNIQFSIGATIVFIIVAVLYILDSDDDDSEEDNEDE